MKLLLPTLVILVLNASSCQTQETNSTIQENPIVSKRITLKRSPLFKDYKNDKLQIADFIEEYFNIMYDSSLEVRNHHWNSKILTHEQDFFLKGGMQRGFFEHYPPKLLGVRKTKEEHYISTLSIDQDGFSLKTINLRLAFDALGNPYFIDQLGKNLENFRKTQKGNCSFYYSPKTQQSDRLEQKTIEFNQKMANFFNVPSKNVKILSFKNIRDYCDALGYEYSPILTYDGQTGGIAMPSENIILCANNSPYYPHELVHLYSKAYPAHYWFDEGLATYFGGSVEYPLEHHLKKVAKAMDSLDFTILPKQEKLDDDTNTKYSLGGLFCKLALEEYGGKEALLKLMNSGTTEEDFHRALEEVFGIKREEQSDFIREKLTPYLSKK